MQRGPLAEPLAWNLVSKDYALEVVPQFEPFAADALRAAALRPGARVLDVAAGPGTLSLLAAQHAQSVEAIDFSSDMVALLKARARDANAVNVTARVGDGQALPYPSASFDAAFSMFGLIFFPDRAQGLLEMKRVLVPDGVAVVSSWRPFSEAPLFAAVIAALAEQLPDLPFGKNKAPLGDAAEVISEMTAAGFREVRVERVAHTTEEPSLASFWSSLERTMAPVVLLRTKMGTAWGPVSERILASLSARFGTGPQSVTMPALLGIGRA